MCEYCQGNESIIVANNCQDGNLVVYIDFDEIVVDNGETYYERREISYCPMCGRELKGE